MDFKELIGKRIVGAEHKQLIGYDDTGYLVLTFSNGTEVTIVGGYDELYTGASEDEYPTRIGMINGRAEGLGELLKND